MHSFSLLHTITRLTKVEEKRQQSVTGKEQPHTCKEKNKTLKKHQHRIIKLTQNAFLFILTHYNASHDSGRKRHQSVTGKGQPHTCKEKNKTLKNHQHRIIKLTQNAFFFHSNTL